MSLRVAVYTRKSSKDNDENHQKYSLERQKRDILRYFENQKKLNNKPSECLAWNAKAGVDWFFEDASAKKLGRPEFNKMLAQIEKSKFDVLLCTDLSRLSRNAYDSGRLVQLLEERKENKKKYSYLKQVRTLDKVFHNTPTDKFTLSLFFSVAKFENDQRGKNTASGIKRKKEDGGTTGRAPIGYDNTGAKKGDKTVRKDPENFEKCRELWDMLLSEQYTLKQIYQRKNQLRLQHEWNKKWRIVSDNTISDMFRKIYYTGQLSDLDEETGEKRLIPGEHPAMVTSEEFETAQFILQKLGHRHAPVARNADNGDLIKAIAVSSETFVAANGDKIPARIVYENRVRITCSKCGHRFYAPRITCSKCETEVTEGTKRAELKRIYLSAKKKKSIPLSSVIEWLNTELNKIKISDNHYQILRKRLYTLWLEEEARYKKEREKINTEIEKLEQERSTLARRKFDENLKPKDKEDRDLAADSVENKIQTKEDELRQLREDNSGKFEMAWQKCQILRDAKKILNEQTEFGPKKNLLLSLVSSLVIHEDHLVVKWRESFVPIAKMDVSNIIPHQKNDVKHHFDQIGSRGRIRTDGQVVNSHLLYH